MIADVKRRSQKKLVRTKLPIDNIMDQTTKTEKVQLLQITTDIRTRLINIKQDALHVGHLLSQAKKILPHGKFQPWIEYFFKGDISYSTAYFYMRIYDTFEGNPSSVKNIPTTYLLMLKEANELIEKQIELQNTMYLESKKTEEKKEEITMLKRKADLRPRFTNHGSSTGISNFSVKLYNNGGTAVNITIRSVNTDFVIMDSIRKDLMIET